MAGCRALARARRRRGGAPRIWDLAQADRRSPDEALEARPEAPRRTFGAQCGPSPGSAPALLAYESGGCARCAARRFARIWTTWIAESLGEVFRPCLSR